MNFFKIQKPRSHVYIFAEITLIHVGSVVGHPLYAKFISFRDSFFFSPDQANIFETLKC